jgi:UDP-2-acetamido-3-amino-2,3-dideoxy-glucuronate N-acetyltransferase
MKKIHPTAEVQSENIGEGTYIWQFCVVLKGAVIGQDCNINCNVFIENDVVIGNNVTIKPGVQVWDGMRIEDNVFIGSNATFTNDLAPRSKQYLPSVEKTILQKGASIGANSTILPGLTIGANSLIGAGSLISKNIPPHTVWYGNPAKHKGYITSRKDILSLELKDKEGRKYKLINDEPVLNDPSS